MTTPRSDASSAGTARGRLFGRGLRPASTAAHPFPVGRWWALAWLGIYLPTYAWSYGLLNFLFLCNVGIALTAVAIWRGERLLLSSQAVAAPAISLAWILDVGWRLITGQNLYGGTAYMWDPSFPLFARVLSCYHALWPMVLYLALRRVGYDRRGWALQAGLAALVIGLSRLADPALNINFAHQDPLFQRAIGGTATHLLVTWGALAFGAYPLAHLAWQRVLPPAQQRYATTLGPVPAS